jgi:hypothetical protein
MSFEDILGTTASVAFAVERVTEIIKPSYLAIKNKILKQNQLECTKPEKIFITIFIGMLLCLTMKVGINVQGIPESGILRQILAGLVSSLGSNVLHALLSIATGLKDTVENRSRR